MSMACIEGSARSEEVTAACGDPLDLVLLVANLIKALSPWDSFDLPHHMAGHTAVLKAFRISALTRWSAETHRVGLCPRQRWGNA